MGMEGNRVFELRCSSTLPELMAIAAGSPVERGTRWTPGEICLSVRPTDGAPTRWQKMWFQILGVIFLDVDGVLAGHDLAIIVRETESSTVAFCEVSHRLGVGLMVLSV